MAWNSEEVRANALYDADFKLTLVMLMEENSSLSEYADYAAQTAASGFRPRFAAITAAEVLEKVRRYVERTSKTNILAGGDTISMNLWAEAIKDTLISWRTELPKAAPAAEPEEITGARSKDMLNNLPAITVSNRHEQQVKDDVSTSPPKTQEAKEEKKEKKKKEKGEGKKGKGTEDGGKKKKKGKSKDEKQDDSGTDTEKDSKKDSSKKKGKADKKSKKDADSDGEGESKGKKEKKRKSKDERKSVKETKAILTASLPLDSSIKVRHTVLRKRGEPKLPRVQVVDDSPKDGAQLYVLLQGFYDIDLLEALQDVGVRLDGIVLLTKNRVDRRNFGVVDIEENFPGTFLPQNMLPNYLQKIEEKYIEGGDKVSKFWHDLVKKLNKSAPDSFIHDIALLNCELPPEPKGFHSQEEISVYSVAVLDETAKRIFEMVILQNWHENYQQSTSVSHVLDGEKQEKLNVYKDFLDKIPSECITLPAIMESLLAQVVDEVERRPDEESQLDAEVQPPKQSQTQTLPAASDLTSEIGSVSVPSTSKPIKQPKTTKSMQSSQRVDDTASRFSLKGKKAKSRKKSISASRDKLRHHEKRSRKARKTLTNINDGSQLASLLNVASDLMGKISSAYSVPGEDDIDVDYFRKPYIFHIPNFVARKVKKPVLGDYYGLRPDLDPCVPQKPAPKFKGPLYIKMHDFASMRTCHLEEELAAMIASAQVYGDFAGIRSFLWDGVPEFNKGLFMKLSANLTQFLAFLPEDEIKVKDLFFIIHLLLAVSIEIELQKQSQRAALKAIEESCDPTLPPDSHYCCDAQAKRFRSLLSLYEPPKPIQASDEVDLDLSHNYLALSENMDKARILLLGSANEKFDVVSSQIPDDYKSSDELKKQLGQSVLPYDGSIAEPAIDPSHIYSAENRHSTFDQQGLTTEVMDDDVAYLLKPSGIKFPSADQGHQQDATHRFPSTDTERIVSKTKMSSNLRPSDTVDTVMIDHINAAAVAAANVITGAGEMATDAELQPDIPPPGSLSEIFKMSFAKEKPAERDCDRECDTKWLQDAKDLAVLLSLIDCPALLALGEEGNLDVSKWIQSYMFCCGLKRAAGQGPILGEIKDWAHAEEMAPVQMVQALSEASQNYLCMERMYCPFYDTILFIFNDPTPDTLQAESSYLNKLNTAVGLQHFLQYTLTDTDVMDFVVESEKRKGLAPIKTLSVETLMRLIPKHQWVLVPSIKYTLKHRDLNQRHGYTVDPLLLYSDGEEEEELLGEGLEESKLGTFYANYNSEAKSLVTPRARKRQRQNIDLQDGQPAPDPEYPPKGGRESGVGAGDQSPGEKSGRDGSVGSGSSKRRKSKDGKKKDKGGKKEKGAGDESDDGKGSKKKDKGEKKDKKGKKGKGRDSVGDTDDEKSGKSNKSPTDGNKKGKVAKPRQTEISRRLLRDGKIVEEMETPLPLLSPQRPSDTDMTADQDGRPKTKGTTADDLVRPSRKDSKKFVVYDLGKRQLITTSDDYHLFPLDGTVISYNVSTIEPDFRMMQLKVSKNGHETIFYPYYIPHEADLTTESFVLCPYFHTVLSNGIRFSFHDKRALEDNQYLKYSATPAFPRPQEASHFSATQIAFLAPSDVAMLFSKNRAFHRPQPMTATDEEEEDEMTEDEDARISKSKSKRPQSMKKLQSEKEVKKAEKEQPTPKGKKKKGKKGGEEKEQGKAADEDSTGGGADDAKKADDEGKDKKKHRHKKGEGGGKGEKSGKKKGRDISTHSITQDGKDERAEEVEESPKIETPDTIGQWKYPSSDETDVDENRHRPSLTSFSFGWDDAKQLIRPFVHDFKITLPSGLFIEVSDDEGPPLTRQVKQAYLSKGSACSLVESSRYYMMNGTVVRFLTDGTIQTINARGVTANIRELYAVHPPGGPTDDPKLDFESSPTTKIFNGDIIMPNGDFYHVSHGRRLSHQGLFVFTSETMPDGEIFRRRQDGTIYIHRADGCSIVHYPDGTRFTTRVLVAPETDPELSDWVFVGLRYMVEHPNYAPIIFNTLSGNIHIRLPQGEWARIFSEGGVRIITRDGYKVDVSENQATLFCPPIPTIGGEIPNMTVVKLYHDKDSLVSTAVSSEEAGEDGDPRKSVPTSSYRGEWYGEYGEEDDGEDGPQKRKVNFSNEYIPKIRKRQSFAGESTKGLMDANLRPMTGPGNRALSSFLLPREDDELEMMDGTKSKTQADHKPSLPESEILRNKKKMELDAFLNFTDLWTMCKAIDSYDNRFAMDIFGNMIVDKSKCYENRSCKSAAEVMQELTRTFNSQQGQLEQHEYLSGLISASSSEVFVTRAQIMNSFKKSVSAADACCKNPKTRVFVVKRDLSGYEFLKDATVQRVFRKARLNADAVVVSDPLPYQTRRNFFTVMEPINDFENPYGLWKNPYREPVFKPRYLCNKDLRVSRPDDFRWFAAVVLNAHHRRGKTFSTPKEEFHKKQELEEVAKQEAQRLEQERLEKEQAEAEARAAAAAAAAEEEKPEEEVKSKKANRRSRVLKGASVPRQSGDEPENKKGRRKSKAAAKKGKGEDETATGDEVPRSSVEKSKRKSASATDKNIEEPIPSSKEHDGVDSELEGGTMTDRSVASDKSSSKGKKKGKKDKEGKTKEDKDVKGKKGGKKRKAEEESNASSVIPPSSAAEVPATAGADEGEEDGLLKTNLEGDLLPEDLDEQRPRSNLLGYPGDYPSNIADIRGLYGPVDSNALMPYPHKESVPTRSALIVRTILEIPRMDENLQHTLLTAAKAYSTAVKEQQRKMQDYIVADPRTEEEKQQEILIRKELLEENIQNMHLLEQSAGKLLDLVL